MKVSCEKSLLLSAANMASRAVASKSSIHAITGILLEANQELRLTGYNLNTGITARVDADVREPGRIVVDSGLFCSMLKKLPDEMVFISATGESVRIQCATCDFNLLGTVADEFPELPAEDTLYTFEIPQLDLQTMIRSTIFACSTDGTRPVQTGELFDINEDGVLTVVAVDGYRLALRRKTLLALRRKTLSDKREQKSFVVPSPALNEVIKLCSSGGNCTVSVGENHVYYSVQDARLVVKRLEGEFVNYRSIIPSDNPVSVLVDRRQLISSIERCALIISEKQKCPLRCAFEKNMLRLRTQTALGTVYDECQAVGGEKLEIGFNHQYMLDAIRNASSDRIRIALNTPVSPAIISSDDEQEGSFLYMVLPVRLKAGM